MPSYDWSFIQQRSGEAIESLVATLLVLEYPDARQVNPSQGDGGVDIIRETAEGIVVWQVKGFTTALSSAQFGQVRASWNRFNSEHVGAGHPAVLEYHLVTPWTPTEERIADFRELTVRSGFICRWDGDAYVSALGDKHPATIHRFTYGDGALEQFVSQKAMIASSPVERADSITMMRAIETRQDALNELRDQLSDHYRIEQGTLTVDGDEPPLPHSTDAAIYHQMVYLGDRRWKYQSVVPRSPGSILEDPVSWEVTFLEEPGTEGFQAVQEWAEWGTPFENVRGTVRMVGGPLPDPSDDYPLADSQLSFSEVKEGNSPPLYLRCTKADGRTRFRWSLSILVRTMGVKTGWMRLVAESPHGVMNIELRLKGPDGIEVNGKIGQLRGRDPESIAAECQVLMSAEDGDVFAVEINQSTPLFKSHGKILPTAIEGVVLPVAEALTALQSQTSSELGMPDISGVTDNQFGLLLRYAKIYGGVPHVWKWRAASVFAPAEVADVGPFVTQLREFVAGRYLPVLVEEPVFSLGEDMYKIDHPLVTVRHSVQFVDPEDLDGVEPNGEIRLQPGADDKVTTSRMAEWTPGSFPL